MQTLLAFLVVSSVCLAQTVNPYPAATHLVPGGSTGVPNLQTNLAGPATTTGAVSVSSLNLTAATLNALVAQCWTGTGFSGGFVTGDLTALACSITARSVSTVTVTFASSSNVVVVLNASGGTGTNGTNGTPGTNGAITTLQVNGTGVTTPATTNLKTGATPNSGLTVTATNPSAGNVEFNITGTPQIPLTSGVTGTLPVTNGGTGVTTKQGNGTKVQLSTGSTVTGDCVMYDANGNTVDAGAACGTGGGGGTVDVNSVKNAIYVQGAGTNTITGTTSQTFASYSDGQIIRLCMAAAANTSTVTVNFNSIGAVALTKNGGTALVSGDLAASACYLLTYRGSLSGFDMTASASGSSTAVPTYNATLNTTTGAVTCDYTAIGGVTPNCRISDNGTLAGATPINISFSNLPTASATAPVRFGILFSTARLKLVQWPASSPSCYIQEQDYAVACSVANQNYWGLTSPLQSPAGAGPSQSVIYHGITWDGTSIWPDRTDGQFQTVVAAHVNSTNFGVGFFSQATQSAVPGAINMLFGSVMNLNQASYLNFSPVTVSALPACPGTYALGSMLVVSDALSPTYNTTVAGGGSIKTPVLCDGVSWKPVITAGTGAVTQAVTAVSSIAITHNLGTSQPWVTCFDGSGNILGGITATTQITNVVATSVNIATVTFSGTTTGTCVVSSGSMGPVGTGATVAIGTVTPLSAGATPTVTNSGTSTAATLNFGLPTAAVPHNITFSVSQTGQVFAGQLGNYSCTISGWSLVGDVSGSATVEIDAHASSTPPAAPAVPNTTTDKISASAPLTISAAQTASSGASGVSTWGTSRSAYDSIAINVTSLTTINRLTGTVYCQ